VHLDHRLDVAPIAVAELCVDLVVDRVELAPKRLELLIAEPRQRALRLYLRWPYGLCCRHL
jgi:hypothetical protein